MLCCVLCWPMMICVQRACILPCAFAACIVRMGEYGRMGNDQCDQHNRRRSMDEGTHVGKMRKINNISAHSEKPVPIKWQPREVKNVFCIRYALRVRFCISCAVAFSERLTCDTLHSTHSMSQKWQHSISTVSQLCRGSDTGHGTSTMGGWMTFSHSNLGSHRNRCERSNE